MSNETKANDWDSLRTLPFPEHYPTAEASQRLYDEMLFPQDYGYFEMLAEFVEHEYVGPEDWAMRGMMASLGIVKGKPFAPDERMRRILSAGAEVGIKMAQALRFGDHLPGTLYYEDRQWNNVLNVFDVEFKEETFLNVDARVGMFIIGRSDQMGGA